MKRNILLVGLIVIALVLTGCGAKEDEKEGSKNPEVATRTCTRTATVTEGVQMDLKYVITYEGDYVTKVDTVEKIITEDQDVLETYEDTLKSTYALFDDIEHYDYDIEVNDDTLTSTVAINYEKIDIDELLAIDTAVETFLTDGKVDLEKITSFYTQLGAVCK